MSAATLAFVPKAAPPRKRRPAASAAPQSPVADAKRRALIPSRPVIEHTKLLRAEMQALLSRANGALLQADSALSVAADDRDMDIALANQRYAAIREGIDAERDDILAAINGIEAALRETDPAPTPTASIEHHEGEHP